METEVLGVDIGGVIADRINDNTDTSFFKENYLKTTMTPGVLSALKRLQTRFPGNIVLISKCGTKIQEKTKEWLTHHNFYNLTGINENQVFFCRKRQEKAGICERLGVTHFIDDRLEVLSHLVTVPNLYLFQPNEAEVAKFAEFLPKVRLRANCWQEILTDLGL